MSSPVNIHAAKTNLSRLIERVEDGEEIVIARAGRPVAKLVPLKPKRAPRKFGTMRGEMWMAPDFDKLPEDELALFYDGPIFPRVSEESEPYDKESKE